MNLILKNLLNNAEKRQDNNSSPPFMGKIRSEKQDRPLPEDLIEHRDIPYGDPEQPLFADSVAATPLGIPVPHFSGCLLRPLLKA